MFRPLDVVQADLGYLEPDFYDVVAEAWDEYATRHREHRGQYLPRQQADLVHRYMELACRRRFEGSAGVVMPPDGSQAFFMDFDQRYRVKPRKLNRDFTVCNNTTRLALDFVDQDDVQTELPGMPDALTKLHLGYLLNVAGSGMASVHVVCPSSVEGNYWEWLLTRPYTMQEPATLPTGRKPGPRARPKESQQPAAEKHDDGSVG